MSAKLPVSRFGLTAGLLVALAVALVQSPVTVAQDEPATPAASEADAPADESAGAEAAAEAAAEAPTPDDAGDEIYDPLEVSEEAGDEAATTDTSAEVDDGAPPAAEPAAAGMEPEAPPADDAAEEEDAGAREDAAADEVVEDVSQTGVEWGMVLTVLAVLIVPVVVGNWAGRALKMPDHGWRIATVLLALSAAGTCVVYGALYDGFKGGPDLSGGITLVYELANPENVVIQEAGADQAPPEAQEKPSIDDIIGALKMRVDPSGTKEVTIRQYGEAIEIIIPHASQEDLPFIKRSLTDLGQLEFRITADPRWPQDAEVIEKALAAPPSQKVIEIAGQPRAKWVEYDVEEFYPVDEQHPSGVVKRRAGDRREALVLLDRYDVTGQYLSNVRQDIDTRTGGPAVAFSFDSQGAARFSRLTGDNLPTPSTSGQKRYRFLGIVLDGELVSAPSIESQISRSGQISGRSMTEAEVEHTVNILNAGSLPAALNKTPISEETISPTLGKTTIEMGRFAIAVSLAAVLLFILFYYRFAGLVACFALALNLLLVLGTMVLLQAAFTLPGLAGLVLTVGMSVDANVLIFERIREELNRGAALRMAIRNGFGRATTTIVDANVTTLITATVLYVIGTDQIKGFAVTLWLGIVMSMFTAIFCSRVIFDIAERKRWIKRLSFSRIIGATNIDFLGMRVPAAVLSLVVIAVGLGAVYARGTGMLNIDFTGGTSVTMVLREGEQMEVADVRDEVVDAQLALDSLEGQDQQSREQLRAELDGRTSLEQFNLLVTERGETGTRFTVNSSVPSTQVVMDTVESVMGDRLQRNSVEIGAVGSYSQDGYEGAEVELMFNQGPAYGDDDGITHDALMERLEQIIAERNLNVRPELANDNYQPDSNQRFKEWTVQLGSVSEEEARAVAEQLQEEMTGQPIFPFANKIGGKVAGDLGAKAIYAIVVSLLGIIGYVWFRFQNVAFGLAAVLALVHDVLVTLGAIGISAYIVSSVPALAQALLVDSFQISLTIVAAFLTIIGYSLNDTIVIFDRVREVRGKSPKITADMINTSLNQTLSRTLLTSLTTLLVVTILYAIGGPGVHAFAFALVVGVIVGTYSTIFVASPALLAMVGARPPATGAGGAKRQEQGDRTINHLPHSTSSR